MAYSDGGQPPLFRTANSATTDPASGGTTSTPTVNEQLARLRSEHVRHLRNVRLKAEANGVGVSDVVVGGQSQPGVAFLTRTAISSAERDERQRAREIKRHFAGPLPPQSWRSEWDSTKQQQQELSQVPLSQRQYRRTVCENQRRMLDNGEPRLNARLPALADLALCALTDTLHQPEPRGSHALEWHIYRRQVCLETLACLPQHLKQRAMALCGREALSAHPLARAAVRALTSTSATPNPAPAPAPTFADWDQDSQNAEDHGIQPISLLDLSFAALTAQTLRSALGGGHTLNVSIRTLLLAGCDIAPDALLRILDSLVNLEVLSLAASSTLPTVRALSRVTPKLHSLDLSYSAVPPTSIRQLDWSVAWPRLSQLYLTNPSLYGAEHAPIANYIAPWHAALPTPVLYPPPRQLPLSPDSGSPVDPQEYERAAVLDAVRGRLSSRGTRSWVDVFF